MAGTIWSGETKFTLASGSSTTITLNVPHRGIIRGYCLTQTSGPLTGTAGAIYTRGEGGGGGNPFGGGGDGLSIAAFHLFDIAPLAADATRIDDHSLNVAYLNRDVGATPTNPKRFLYLQIEKNGGQGDCDYVFSITIETPTLR
jgi:hypothetical protein